VSRDFIDASDGGEACILRYRFERDRHDVQGVHAKQFRCSLWQSACHSAAPPGGRANLPRVLRKTSLAGFAAFLASAAGPVDLSRPAAASVEIHRRSFWV